ncbi:MULTISPECIES: hypothetical protein [unclassified Micromonospora]|uniref:hypothetical protein n=1 Tax=unclassified Micromonospora TaxID=2617518 RepID=UPI00362EA3A1
MVGDQSRSEQVVAALAALTGWDGDSPNRPDWTSFESAFGRPFPNDFKRYVERFPPGAFELLAVFHPLDVDYGDDPRSYVLQLIERNEPVNDFGNPFRFGIEPGELLAWGTVNGEYELCWQLTNDEPDSWGCVVVDMAARTGERYSGGMVDLLISVLSGASGISSLDYLRDALPMSFVPYD